MPVSLAKEHRDFYQKHNLIEFSGLLTPSQLEDFSQAVTTTLAEQEKEKNAFRNVGRDLWRRHPLIKKISLRRDLAQVVAGLLHQREIRLGYDQFITTHADKECMLPSGTTSLQEISSVKPVLMGLLIRLSAGAVPVHNQDATFPCPCPTMPGDGVFFSSNLLVSWEPLLALPNQHFFLIVYAGAQPLYVMEKRDPCAHALKQQGYVFGDKLKSDTHPILYTS